MNVQCELYMNPFFIAQIAKNLKKSERNMPPLKRLSSITGHQHLRVASSQSQRNISITLEAMMRKWKSGVERILKCLSG